MVRIAIGRKQLIVSLSDVASECRVGADQRHMERLASRRAFANTRARREIAAQLSGAARLRTP